ncbi:MAG: Gfo/Idh/MocA family oxidoreductase [Candidatus Latescibacterota bacterium]|nr:Gfo/Idh/MocA family oxidoreductase [Candidatus Latescibacterota bacterium]
MPTLRLAFIGFRHGHIFSLYEAATESEEVQIVAACEEDEAKRKSLQAAGDVEVTHDQAAQLLADVDCDAVAIGDVYARRGGLAIAALEAGRHVIVDKPLCTSLAECDRIAATADNAGLQVGCMLTMRDSGGMQLTRQLLSTGEIGEIHAITFGGQHPLLLGSRPDWYFEPGMHGGTINDIGIHAIDAIPWATGLRFTRIEAARCWNAIPDQSPHFKDGAQLMLTMSNGCGVMGDVSYFMPDRAGYRLPYYWRTMFWGSGGVIEYSSGATHLEITRTDDTETEHRPCPPARSSYLQAFLAAVHDDRAMDGALTTPQVLESTRIALQIQAAADEQRHGVDL